MSAAILFPHIFLYFVILSFYLLSSLAILIAPSNIVWQHDRDAAIPALQSGRIQIQWNPAVGSVDHYEIEVSPLDYTDKLQNPVSSGFILVCILPTLSIVISSFFESCTTESIWGEKNTRCC